MLDGIGHARFKKVKWMFGKEIEIPEEWTKIKLNEVCLDTPMYGANEPALEEDPNLPRYIRITDIDDNGNLKQTKVSVCLENNEKYLLENNDFLFARTGSIGRTFLFSEKYGQCIFAGYLIRFKLDKNKTIPKFLYYYTHSKVYWSWVFSQSTHGVQPNMNAKQYSSLTIILPPIPEQQKIASILSGIDALI